MRSHIKQGSEQLGSDHVFFGNNVKLTLMPDFRHEISVVEGAIKVPVINVERNPILRDVAK
jgi:hypothetical protein